VLVQESLEPLGGLAQLGDKGEVAHLVLMLPHETHQLGLCLAYLLWGVNLQAKRVEGLSLVLTSVVRRVPLSISANGFIGTRSKYL
jgi:hypothetical protein